MHRGAYLFFVFSLLMSQFCMTQQLHLKLVGQTQSETMTIDSLGYQKIFTDFQSLQGEIKVVNTRLQKLGFVENEVIETTKINDSSYLSTFSLKRRFYTIYIYYPKTEDFRAILENLANEVTDTYFVTSIDQVENVLNHLANEIVKNGDPFAKLKLDEIEIKDGVHLQAHLVITSDGIRYIDDVVVKGYEKFPKSYLKHFLKIKKGKVFNLEAIKEKTEALNNLPFANESRSPEVLFTKDSTSIYLYIQKVKSNTFDGFLGFGTNESTNKIEFDGYLNLQLHNNLNFGESFTLFYKSDEIDQKTFDVRLTMPFLFGSPLGSEMNLNIFKKDSSFTTVTQSADLFYQFNKNQRLFLGIKGFQSNNLLQQSNENIEDFDTFMYTIKYNYVVRQPNSILFPINFQVDAAYGFGNRKQMGMSTPQQSYFINASKIFNLGAKNSIYINARSSGLFSDTYLDNELLRFGGITSIRGFEENSLVATLYGLVNTEYRYKLNRTIYIHSILDAAYLDNAFLATEENLFGVGFGFGIITKSGLLKLNYANGKFEDQRFKFSDSKIHISLNARF